MSAEPTPHSVQDLVERIRLDLEFSPSDDGWKALDSLVEQLEAATRALDLACADLAGTPVEAERVKRGYLNASSPASRSS